MAPAREVQTGATVAVQPVARLEAAVHQPGVQPAARLLEELEVQLLEVQRLEVQRLAALLLLVALTVELVLGSALESPLRPHASSS